MYLTYQLQENNSAKQYYEITNRLAVQLQNQIKDILGKPVQEFINYIQEESLETVRTDVEYAIELLDFAILHRWIQCVLNDKPYNLVDTICTDLEESIAFMRGSGEFKEEVCRFQNWIDFFQMYEQAQWKELWNKIGSVVDKIDESGNRYLQKYLSYLDVYLENHKYAWENREDAALILRDKSCYYINMIAAQILNNYYEKEFCSCHKVYIFLPGCMAKQMENCQAMERPDGYVCVACSSECQVNGLSKKYPGVRIVYHGSQMEKKQVNGCEKIGVVGVACILNLIAGGWKAKRLGYVPQCVILNECGCNTHWDEKGVVTSLDEQHLQQKLMPLC